MLARSRRRRRAGTRSTSVSRRITERIISGRWRRIVVIAAAAAIVTVVDEGRLAWRRATRTARWRRLNGVRTETRRCCPGIRTWPRHLPLDNHLTWGCKNALRTKSDGSQGELVSCFFHFVTTVRNRHYYSRVDNHRSTINMQSHGTASLDSARRKTCNKLFLNQSRKSNRRDPRQLFYWRWKRPKKSHLYGYKVNWPSASSNENDDEHTLTNDHVGKMTSSCFIRPLSHSCSPHTP